MRHPICPRLKRAVLPLLLTALVARLGLSQSPPRSVTHDTTPPDSQPRHFAEWEMLPFFAGFAAVLAVAPASFVFFHRADPPGALPNSHTAAYMSGGGAGTLRGNSFHWFYTEEVEGWNGHLYGDVRDESFRGPAYRRFLSVRGGYLLHPRPGIEGGLTLGYRVADNGPAPRAVIVGLPMMLGSEKGFVWWEPTYLVSSAGVSWNYRFQAEFYVVPTRLLAGPAFDFQPLQQGGAYVGTMTLLFGARF
jgi:hypothetical protein